MSEVPNLVLNAPGQESSAEPKAKAKGKAKAKSKSSAKRKAKAKAKALTKAPSPVAKAASKAAPVAAAKAAASTCESSELALRNLRITKATYLTGCTCGGSGPHKSRVIVEYSERKDGVNHESKCENAKEHIISQKLGIALPRTFEICSRSDF